MTKKYVAGVFVQQFDRVQCLYITEDGSSFSPIDAVRFKTEDEAAEVAEERAKDFSVFEDDVRTFVEEV